MDDIWEKLKNLREDNETNAALEVMVSNLDNQNEPYLGIFWFDPTNVELFGVHSTPAEDCKWYYASQFGNEVRTCRALHSNIWQKEYHRGKDPRFTGDYTKMPRGRVFQFKDKGFIVYTGNWIKEFPWVKEDIIEEFQLPRDQTTFKIDNYWDLGHGWSNEF